MPPMMIQLIDIDSEKLKEARMVARNNVVKLKRLFVFDQKFPSVLRTSSSSSEKSVVEPSSVCCLGFRALSDQLYNTPDHHKFVRQVVNQLKSHPEIYEGYVPMEYNEYLEKMSKSGEWGDHVTLHAAANSFRSEGCPALWILAVVRYVFSALEVEE